MHYTELEVLIDRFINKSLYINMHYDMFEIDAIFLLLQQQFHWFW